MTYVNSRLARKNGTYMRLLGGIFRPSRNHVIWGRGKLWICGAGITGAPPCDTVWERSPSTKPPISDTHRHRKRGHMSHGWHFTGGYSGSSMVPKAGLVIRQVRSLIKGLTRLQQNNNVPDTEILKILKVLSDTHDRLQGYSN